MRHFGQLTKGIGISAATLCAVIVILARGRKWASCKIVLASSLLLAGQAAADPRWQSYVFALNQFDGSVTATLTVPSRAQRAESGPSAVCVVDLPGGAFSFKRLVDVLASGMFALRAEIPYPYVAARPKPDISVRFAQLGREIMVFHFEDRSDQLGVRGWLDDQSSGRVAHYRIQANPAFLNNLRGLVRTSTTDRGC